ncbi:MAG: fibronectin type III domain-containing protein [Candidatus Thermoplasmatota archaeon]|nr:fibronectin type III domain-containing protein [Candidatus Thermoplasmatota archaeon]
MMMKGLSALMVSVLLLTTLLVWQPTAGEDVPFEEDGTTVKMPVSPSDEGFIENIGQWEDEILFHASTGFGHVGLGRERIYYDVMEQLEGPLPGNHRMRGVGEEVVEGAVLTLDLRGSNGVDPTGGNEMPGVSNYFVGNDPSRWANGARSFGFVEYRNVWDGVSLVFSLRESSLKYDLYLDPGVDTSEVVFGVDGHTGLTSDGRELSIETPIGTILKDSGLVAFYTDGEKERTNVRFRLIDESSYTFKLDGRDPNRGVLIDPIVYSSYLGGSADDGIFDCDLDSNGNNYLVGITDSKDFPITTGVYQTTYNGNYDIFVTKTNPSGSSIIFSTYIGGSDYDTGNGIKVDGSGNTFVAGSSYSLDFPTTSGAYNETHWNESWWTDVIVFKLSSAGDSLIYSTYVGGEYDEEAMDIDIDLQGSAYVVGSSYSLEFPTTSDAYDDTGDDWAGDMILFKLSVDGSSLDYSTYFGGSDGDQASGIVYDGSGNVYVAGSSWSYDIPTTSSAYQQKNMGYFDVVVFELNIDRSTLVYCTYVGGDDDDQSESITVDSTGNAFVTGYTFGGRMLFPTTTGAYSTTHGGNYDSFAFKLDPTGSRLLYSTFLGGSSEDYGYGIDTDPNGRAYICGYTASANYPTTPGADYTSFRGGYYDATVSVLSSSGAALVFSSYLGGSSDDFAWSLKVDPMANALVVGYTASTNYPVTTGVISTSNKGGIDGCLSMVNFTLPPTTPTGFIVTPGDGFIDLGWSEPGSDGGWPVTKYTVYKRAEDQTVPFTINVTELGYNDTDVELGVKYYYSVSASNRWREGPRTIEVLGISTSVPYPPINLSAVVSVGKVELDWEVPAFNGGTPITGYMVHRGNVSGDLELLKETAPVATSYTDLEVEPGMTYYYHITAINLNGGSAPGNEVQAVLPDVPGAPVDLTMERGDTFVHISWGAPAWDGGVPVMSYKIYKGEEQDDLALLKTVSSGTIGYNDTKVINGINYYYTVTAINDVGESQPAESISAIPMTIPSAPTLQEPLVGDASLTLTWDPPMNDGGSSVLKFLIYSGDSSETLVFLDQIDADEIEFIHSGLTNGMMYHYQITALNSFGESPRSNMISGTPLGLPDPPTSVEFLSGDGFVQLTWFAPADDGGAEVNSYHLFRAVGTGDPILYRIITTTRYNDTEVTNGQTYHYWLTSLNIVGESVRTKEVSALPLGLPGTPTGFFLEVGNGQVDLSWVAPTKTGGAPLLSYMLYRSEDGNEFLLLDELGTEITDYRDRDVENGNVYYYRLTVKNILGESAFTETLNALPFGLPSALRDMKIEEMDGTVLITWELPEDDGGSPLTAIKVYRSREGGVQQKIASLDGTVTSYTDRNVIVGVTYSYVVKAENKAGESPSAAPLQIMIKEPEEKSNTGLLVGIIIVVVVLAIIALVIFLVMRKRKRTEAVPPQLPYYPGTGQMAPGMMPVQGLPYDQTVYQQFPGQVPGQQGALPSPQQPLLQQQEAVYQGSVGYQRPSSETPLYDGYQEPEAQYYQEQPQYQEEAVQGTPEYAPAEPEQPVQVPEEMTPQKQPVEQTPQGGLPPPPTLPGSVEGDT